MRRFYGPTPLCEELGEPLTTAGWALVEWLQSKERDQVNLLAVASLQITLTTHQRMGDKRLKKICELGKVDISYLLSALGEFNTSKTCSVTVAKKAQIELLKLVNGMYATRAILNRQADALHVQLREVRAQY